MIVINRQSASSSAGSTVVAEEPEAILQGLEDVITDVKSSGSLLDYSSLQGQIQELKQENEEKLHSVAESVEREKAKLRPVHADKIESQRRKHQEALEKLQCEKRQAEERTNGLTREVDMLRGELAARNETVGEMRVQVRDLSSANEELQDALQNLKMNLGEVETMVEELRLQNTDLEREQQELEKQRDEMQIEFSREKEMSNSALEKLASDHADNMLNASNTISHLGKELSSSSTTINQLHESLYTVTCTSETLSKEVDGRTADVQWLERTVSELQSSNQTLEKTVDDMMIQMKSMEDNATREHAELCEKHSNEINGERRIVQNLQSSLESSRLEMGVMRSEMAALNEEKNGLLDRIGLLEERCKCGEQQVERLNAELTRANDLAHELEEKGRVSQEESRKEISELMNSLNLLHRQSDDASKQLAERNSQVQILQVTNDKLVTTLHHAQTSVNEKTGTISELQQRNAMLEKTRHDLEGQLFNLEETVVETRETSQNILVRTNEKHNYEIAESRARIQELQDELSSVTNTAQQLHASLETSHAENAKSQHIIEKCSQEISQLSQRLTASQDYSRSLEAKNEESFSQMRLREQTVHEENALLLHNHTTEIQTMQSLKESLERDLREKEERLAKSIGENNILRDQVSFIEERSQNQEAEITAAYVTLHEVTERSKASIEKMEEERARIEDETVRSRHQVEELQKELKEREDELNQLKAAPFLKLGVALSNALGGSWFFLGASNSASQRSEPNV